MGALAPGSAHARPSAQPPIDTKEKFPAHMIGRGGKQNWQINRSIFSPFHATLSTFRFSRLKLHATFQNPRITPSGRKVTTSDEEREKNAVNSGHLVPWQRTQAAWTNFLRVGGYWKLQTFWDTNSLTITETQKRKEKLSSLAKYFFISVWLVLL